MVVVVVVVVVHRVTGVCPQFDILWRALTVKRNIVVLYPSGGLFFFYDYSYDNFLFIHLRYFFFLMFETLFLF